MVNTVIVALPAADEKVNKISSEEVAHLTLLFLGDVELSAEAVLYVQHAASELSPFYMSVDYRDTLGPDDADVVFFEKNGWDISRISEFRHYLLLNDEIRRAYDSVEQYPEWTPHLTLGYPEKPAIVDPEDDPPRLYGIQFDRIAVWVEDFDGPEFRLKYDEHLTDSPSVGWSDMSFEDTIAHYGKKGMRWGVRNDKGHEGEAVKTKKLEKLDKKWEKGEERNAFWQSHNAAADKMNNGEIDRINNKPEHSKAADEGKFEDWENPTPELNAYMKDMDDTFAQHFANAVVARGSNPSGTKRYELMVDENGDVYAELKDVKHSATSDADVRYKISKNAKGLITKYTPEEIKAEESDVTHAEMSFEDTIAHYGKKGMKWGVTTVDKASSVTRTQNTPPKKGAKDVTVSQKKAGRFVKSKGGERHAATDEAVKAQAARQKAKKSTTDSLSNDELKAAVERMNLEQQFNKLERKTERQSLGQLFAEALFGENK